MLPSNLRCALMLTSSPLLRATFIALCVLLKLSACHGPDPRATQPFEPTQLRAELSSLAEEAARLTEGDQAALEHFRVARLSPLLLSPGELSALLQPRGGRPSPVVSALIKRYREVLAPAFLKEAPAVLAQAWRAGLTHVHLSRVGPSRGELNTPGDLKMLEALPKRPPLYHARFIPNDTQDPLEARGLRINGLLYTPAGWKTLLKLGESLEGWRRAELNLPVAQ